MDAEHLADLVADRACSGFSAVIGSWKIIADPRAAHARASRASVRPRRSRAVEPDARRRRLHTRRQQADDGAAVIDLPEPHSPTTHRISLRARLKETSASAWLRPAPGGRRTSAVELSTGPSMADGGSAWATLIGSSGAGSARRSGPGRPATPRAPSAGSRCPGSPTRTIACAARRGPGRSGCPRTRRSDRTAPRNASALSIRIASAMTTLA